MRRRRSSISEVDREHKRTRSDEPNGHHQSNDHEPSTGPSNTNSDTREILTLLHQLRPEHLNVLQRIVQLPREQLEAVSGYLDREERSNAGRGISRSHTGQDGPVASDLEVQNSQSLGGDFEANGTRGLASNAKVWRTRDTGLQQPSASGSNGRVYGSEQRPSPNDAVQSSSPPSSFARRNNRQYIPSNPQTTQPPNGTHGRFQALKSWLQCSSSNQNIPGRSDTGYARSSNNNPGFSECKKIVAFVREHYGSVLAYRMIKGAERSLNQHSAGCVLCNDMHAYCVLMALLDHHPQLRSLDLDAFKQAYESRQYNPQQMAAVTADEDAPLLINAGPGTGKTATLVGRVLYLLSRGIPPHRLIVITFTRNAAETLVQRCSTISGQNLYFPFVRTIDSLSTLLCKLFIPGQLPTIIDDEDYVDMVVDSLCQNNELEGYRRKLAKGINDFYRTGERAEEWLRPILGQMSNIGIQKRLWDQSICTHRVRLLSAINKLTENPPLADHFRERYYYLVDEYQDVDLWQAQFVFRMVIGQYAFNQQQAPTDAYRRITVVGDDDQSIYKFRGAAPDIMQRFWKMFKDNGLQEVTLLSNYRTIQPIIDFNTQIIGLVRSRIKESDEPFRSEADHAARGVTCGEIGICYHTTLDEACQHTYSATTALMMTTHNVAPSDVAILAYRNDECTRITETFTENGRTPFTDLLISTVHGAKGLERPHVFVILAIRRGKVCASDEERRLIYVALTRTKYTLHITLFESGQPTSSWDELISGLMGSSAPFPTPKCIHAEAEELEDLRSSEDDERSESMDFLPPILPLVPPSQDSDRTTIGGPSQDYQNHRSLTYSPTPQSLSASYQLPSSSLRVEDFSPPAPTHYLSATKIAQYFIMHCPRLLHRLALPSTNKGKAPAVEETPVARLLMQSGDAWETRIVESIRQSSLLAFSQPKIANAKELVELILSTKDGHYIYEPNISVSSDVNLDVGLTTRSSPIQPRINVIKPDFLLVFRKEEGIIVQILDAKFSVEAKAYQKIQVALYHLVLNAMLRRASTYDSNSNGPNIQLHPQGIIWLPGTDRALGASTSNSNQMPLQTTLGTRSPFDFEGIIAGIKYFFRTELPNILSPPGEKNFHITADCAECQYLPDCTAEAKRTNDLCLIPDLRKQQKKSLQGEGIKDVEDLLSGRGDHIVDKGAVRAKSVMDQRPHPLGRPSIRVPKLSDETIILTFNQDPVDHTAVMYGYGHYIGSECKSTKQYVDETDANIESILKRLSKIMVEAKKAKKSLQIWTGELGELTLFGNFLIRVLGNERLGENAWKAAEVILGSCVVDEALAQLKELTERCDPTAAKSALCIVNEVKAMFALPLPASTVPDTRRVLVNPSNGLAAPVLPAPDARSHLLVTLHNARLRGTVEPILREEIKNAVQRQLEESQELLSTFQRLADAYLIAEPQAFELAEKIGIKSPILSQLAYLRLLEAVTECDDLTYERFTAPDPMIVRPIEKVDGLKTFYCEMLTDAADDHISTEPDTFNQYLIVAEEHRNELLNVQDLDMLRYVGPEQFNKRCKLPEVHAATIHFLDNEAKTVEVRFGTTVTNVWEHNGNQRRHLVFKRYMNTMLGKSIRHLKDLDKHISDQNRAREIPYEPLLLRLIQGRRLHSETPIGCPPNGWWPVAANNTLQISATKRIELSAQHRTIIQAVQSKPVQLLVGPPGTGKSFFLAALILSRLHQAKATKTSRKQFILLTAWTHSAIDTVIDKMLEHLPDYTEQPTIIRLWDRDRPSSPLPINYISTKTSERQLKSLFKEHDHAVICGTTWQLSKISPCLPGISCTDRMLCIEESSLMPIIEASVALSLVPAEPKNGSVLMIGDHLQIGTLIKGRSRHRVEQDKGLRDSLFNYIIGLGAEGMTPVSLVSTWRLNKVAASILRRFVGYSGYSPATLEVGRQNIGQLIGKSASKRPEFADFDHSGEMLSKLLQTMADPKKPMIVAVLRDTDRTGTLEKMEILLAAHITRLLQTLAHNFPLDILHMVTHHRKRVALKNALSAIAPQSNSPILTIHKSQGKESDIGIILFASSPEQTISESTFLYDRKLMNVALSRARRKTVMIISDSLLHCLEAVGSDGTLEGFQLLHLLVRETKLRDTYFDLDCGELGRRLGSGDSDDSSIEYT